LKFQVLKETKIAFNNVIDEITQDEFASKFFGGRLSYISQ